MNEITLFFMKKILKLGKIILLIMFLVIEFFPIAATYQFFRNNWILINHGLFPGQNKKRNFKIFFIKNNFFFQKT